MAKPNLGTKRVCLECSTKFFDLNRQPILCPKCGAIFEIAARDKTPPADVVPKKKVAEDASPVSVAVAEKAADDTADINDTDGEVEIISLEDAEDKGEIDPDDDDDTVAGLPDDDDVSDIVVSGDGGDDT